jgi:uncharacterized protein (UPF0179 family)
LQKGQLYEVVQVMTKEHSCPHELHEEDMVLVKVKVPDMVVSMENKIVFEGSVVSYAPIKCEFSTCSYHEFCVPELIVTAGDRLRVKERLEKIKNCPKGLSLSKVCVEKK